MNKVFDWLVNFVQLAVFVIFWQLFYAPTPKLPGSVDGLWIFGHVVPLNWTWNVFGVEVYLVTLIGTGAVLYVLLGAMQATFRPKANEKQAGADLFCSVILFLLFLVTWVVKSVNKEFHMSDFAQQVLWVGFWATLLDVFAGSFILPRVKKILDTHLDA